MDNVSARPLAHTIPNAARAIGAGRTKIYEMIAAGELDARKLGGRTVVTDESLRALIEAAPKAAIGGSRRQ